jgi:hypothetical protein
VDWPLLAGTPSRKARLGFCPASEAAAELDNVEDIAILELNGEPPPDARPISLLETDALWQHPFRAFGFPAKHADGVWAAGVLCGPNAANLIQIESVKDAGYSVQPGFSGGPVWDNQLGGVVGMVVATETGVKAALVIPGYILLKAYGSTKQRLPGCRS